MGGVGRDRVMHGEQFEFAPAWSPSPPGWLSWAFARYSQDTSANIYLVESPINTPGQHGDCERPGPWRRGDRCISSGVRFRTRHTHRRLSSHAVRRLTASAGGAFQGGNSL